jgi:GT2 family glycosyltransferase
LPELSIVIPTLGRQEILQQVLERLERQDANPASFEVIVVADAAEPDLAGVCGLMGEHPFHARFLSAGKPGASPARNVGWRAAEAPLVLFLDDDILPERWLLSEHLAWHRRHPEESVGVLGHVRWADELKVTPFMRWLEHGIQFDYPNIHGAEAGWGRFYTANASVKRALLARVSGFEEERLPFGYEDLDLAYRMSRHGFRLLYNRRASAEHLHPMDLAFWRRRMERIAFAEREFVRLHPEIPPYFHDLCSEAARAPAPRGRGVRLAPIVPRWLPWLGPRVWASVDRFYRHALAEPFLDAWREADAADASLRPRPMTDR